jgi:hypothetical protein
MNAEDLLNSIRASRGGMTDPVDPAAQEAAQAAMDERRRALAIHSAHILLPAEQNFIRTIGRNPENYAAIPLAGQIGINRDPRTGQMFLMAATPIPPDFFPALDKPVFQADGSVSAPRFDRALGGQITVRVVIELAELGELLRKRVEALVEHEGKTFGELENTGYPFNPAPTA